MLRRRRLRPRSKSAGRDFKPLLHHHQLVRWLRSSRCFTTTTTTTTLKTLDGSDLTD
jgi:hypothetical protein